VRPLALLLALLLPCAAAAEPAVVKVFEAPARAEPAPGAPVLHTFVEGAAVSVSEAAERGWRRVRLPDGATGWIEEAALRLGPAAEPAAAGQAGKLATPSAVLPPPAPPPPDLRTRVYVKDLDHLAELTRVDPVVGPRTLALAERQARARTALIATGVATLGLIVLGIADPWKEPCPGGVACVRPMSGGAKFAFGAGLAVPWIGGGLAWAASPKREELLDVINDWNARHPGEPFSLEAHQAGAPATMSR
jgi:hypothetical protein